MGMSSHRYFVSLLAGVALTPTMSWAQQASAPTAAAVAETGPEGDADIIVSARRRAERLVDVPIAITALDSKALDRYATTSIEGIGRQIPQVQITRTGAGSGAQVTIRGIGSNASSDDSVEQSVAFNIDGVPTSRGRAIQQGLFDLSNVQILKGPQALYFGKNSPAGVIVIESKGPGDRLEGYVRAGYEFRADEYSGEAAIGGPVTETLGVRVAVRGSDMTKGYVRNVAKAIPAASSPIAFDRVNGFSIPGPDFAWGPNTKQVAGRITIAWKPTADFDLTLKGFESYSKDQGDSSQTVVIRCAPGDQFPYTNDLSAIAFGGAPVRIYDTSQNCVNNGRQNSIGQLPDQLKAGIPSKFSKDTNLSKVRSHLYSMQINYRGDNFNVGSTTGFYKFRSDSSGNVDSAGFSLVGGGAIERSRSFTQELRVTTTFASPVNFVVGGFYANEKRTYDIFSMLLRNLDPATGITPSALGRAAVEGSTLSAFGELDWKITPELTLSAGARYTHETKDGFLVNDYVAPGVTTQLRLFLPAGTRIESSITDNNVSPQATLTWHPLPNVTVYGGYRTGFKAGTISNPGSITSALNRNTVTVGAEKAEGYEGGVKFETDDRRLSGEVSIYHYTFKNLQVQAFDVTANASITKNAGAATTDGVDLSASYRASDAFTVRGAVGYNRARYSVFTNSSCYSGQTVALGCSGSIQNLTGQPLPRAPKWAGSLGATFEQPLSESTILTVTADGYYTSGYYSSAVNSPFLYQTGFGRVDASVRLHHTPSGFELAVIGRNLTDKRFFDYGSDRLLTGPEAVRASLGAPRTVMVQGSYTF